jgi:predicted transposase
MTQVELKQIIIQRLNRMQPEQLAFLVSFLDTFETYSQSVSQSQLTAEKRHELVKSLQGKYAYTSTSSDDFAGRKQADEDCG